MTFPQITLHAEVVFDSMNADPNPWWLPFFWVRVYREGRHWHRVLRTGVLGIHVCLSACYYPSEEKQ